MKLQATTRPGNLLEIKCFFALQAALQRFWLKSFNQPGLSDQARQEWIRMAVIGKPNSVLRDHAQEQLFNRWWKPR